MVLQIKMSRDDTEFKKYATEYDPIKIGSIDGVFLVILVYY